MIDKDKSGTVDSKELLEALQCSEIDEKLVKEFISLYDKDGDGKLSVKELEAFLTECGE